MFKVKFYESKIEFDSAKIVNRKKQYGIHNKMFTIHKSNSIAIWHKIEEEKKLKQYELIFLCTFSIFVNLLTGHNFNFMEL